MLAFALPAGLLIGLCLGALGAGGSILAVPVLVYLLGQTPHQATTISLVIVGVAALTGAVAHRRAGRVRLGAGLAFGALGVAGSYAGSRAAALVNPHLLLTAFAALMVAAAAAMLIRQRREDAGTARPGPVQDADGDRLRLAPATAARTVLAATVVGALTGFFGVGGGFIVVPALVLALGMDTPTAVGTSLVVIAVNSGTALASRVAGGTAAVSWTLTGVFTAAAVAGTLLGSRIAARVDRRRLTEAFTALLLAVAAYTAATSIAGTA